jgi:hypothetical protein
MTGDVGGEPAKEYVGMIWIADQPGQRVRVLARSLAEAKKEVERIYGEGHVISIYNEDDADRRR